MRSVLKLVKRSLERLYFMKLLHLVSQFTFTSKYQKYCYIVLLRSYSFPQSIARVQQEIPIFLLTSRVKEGNTVNRN